MTIATLKRIRNNESFDLFWQKIEKARQSLDVGEPLLPRKRKALKRHDHGSAYPEFLMTTSHFIDNISRDAPILPA